MQEPHGPTIGTPAQDIMTWDGVQSYDNCQIRSEEFLIEMFTGQEVDEDMLVQQAADNGWYAPGAGTAPEFSGNLMEMYGVPNTTYEYGTTWDLANELAQGHKVIVGVDADELWSQAEEGEPPENMTDNHAIVVSGIDTSNPDDVRVIISDPGTGEAMARYPMDQFVAAWEDSDFSITATDEPAPASLPEMANFDYEAGHIPEVMDMPYDEFSSLDPESPEWNTAVQEAYPADGVDNSMVVGETVYPDGASSEGATIGAGVGETGFEPEPGLEPEPEDGCCD